MFKKLALAGTFDHLHLGHQSFIKQALSQAESCICGVTTDWIRQKKVLPKTIQSYSRRVNNLETFLENHRLRQRVKLIPLNDQVGPTLADPAIDTLAITIESLPGAKFINEQRRLQGLKPLPFFISQIVKSADQQKISSTRVRLGEINRQGLVYSRLLAQTETMILPAVERQYFRKPLGQLITGSSQSLTWAAYQVAKQIKKQLPLFVITVGDITTQACIQQQIKIDLAVVDYRSQRQPLADNFHRVLKNKADWFQIINNQPGTISLTATKLIMNFLPQMALHSKTGLMQICGEEDLLVLPLVLLAPLQTVVLYGQPHQGIVQTVVTETLKEKVIQLLSKFHPG